jgi:CheY-like chemotaxis protein
METASKPKKLAVLFIEDDENDVEILKLTFKKLGRGDWLSVVRDGPSAIDYLEKQSTAPNGNGRPDLIVTDLKMPQMSGFDFLKWLQDTPSLSMIPTVVLSGSTMQKDVNLAYELGARSYLTKPVDFVEYGKSIRTMLDFWLLSLRPAEAVNGDGAAHPPRA